MKRIFDVIVSFSAILILSPLLVIIYFMIKKDGGSSLFKQERIGLDGNLFLIYKFRSMVVDASKLGGYSTLANDNRITKIGKLIRRTSIDELPQLFNVLKGDMSIVGPRPNVPEQIKEYRESDWEKRNSILPGITGLSQANYRSEATFDQRLKSDLYYVDNKSMVLDMKIIMMTVKQIISKGGN